MRLRKALGALLPQGQFVGLGVVGFGQWVSGNLLLEEEEGKEKKGAKLIFDTGAIVTSDIVPIEIRGTYQSWSNLTYGLGGM